MGVGLLLVGIAGGLLAAVGVLILGGGFWVAALAYIGGGLVGMLGGVAHAVMPKQHGANILSQDQG